MGYMQLDHQARGCAALDRAAFYLSIPPECRCRRPVLIPL